MDTGKGKKERLGKKQREFIANVVRTRGPNFDFVRIGMLVSVDGDIGTIRGLNSSANLNIIFANQLKHGKEMYPVHPTDNICYFDADNRIIRNFGLPITVCDRCGHPASVPIFKMVDGCLTVCDLEELTPDPHSGE